MINFVKTINSPCVICLNNYKNVFCYFISVLHRLHTSVTLNEFAKGYFDVTDLEGRRLLDSDHISEIVRSGNVFDILILPVALYAQLDETDESSRIRTNTLIELYFKTIVQNEFVSSNAVKCGYSPELMMSCFMMPTIHKLCPDKFKNILFEVRTSKIQFANSDSAFGQVILDNSFLSEPYRQNMFEAYKEMMTDDFPTTIDVSKFCAGTLETWANLNMTYGHALTLVKGKANGVGDDTFYVIDDAKAIMTLAEYRQQHEDSLVKIDIKNIDLNTMNEINAALYEPNEDRANVCQFENKVNSATIDFKKNFKPEAFTFVGTKSTIEPLTTFANSDTKADIFSKRSATVPHWETSSQLVHGGNKKSLKIWLPFIILAIIIVVIIYATRKLEPAATTLTTIHRTPYASTI